MAHSMDRRALLAGAGSLIAAAPALAEAAAPGAADLAVLDRQIGQMIMMGFRGADPGAPGARAIADWLRRGLIGGVIFFEDNAPSPAAVRRLIAAFEDAAGAARPFFAVDQEGGVVARLRDFRGFAPLPAAADLARRTPAEAEAAYDRAAAELERLGFNLNFGPVVDLAVNDRNPIIEALGRSYGVDPETVVAYARAFIDAHHRRHVLTALKHFPGHGSATVDSHKGLPTVTAVWRQAELAPFASLIRDGDADMVMVAHLVQRAYTGDLPASLSREAIQGLLRRDLGYQGVVVSDDMQMGALRRNFSPERCIQLGLQAGVDLFIYSNREHPDPRMPELFHQVAAAAVQAGRLAPAQIAGSAARLDRLKQSLARPARFATGPKRSR